MEDIKENDFSPEESLRLIQSMIATTKNSIGDRSRYFLLWGWGVFIASVLQYYLKVIVQNPKNGEAWLIMPVILVVHIFFIVQDKKEEKIKTFINEANQYLWTALIFSFIVLPFMFNQIGWENCYPIYIVLYGIGTYVSGRLIKFKPLIIGGILCFPLSVLATYLNPDLRILATAFALFISYIIPGHLLRLQYRKQKH